jgi:hypothetical protein
MIHPRRHDTGWPRFTVSQRTHSSDQSHRIYIQVQGGIDSHDARGPTWEGVQYRPLKPPAGGFSSAGLKSRACKRPNPKRSPSQC